MTKYINYIALWWLNKAAFCPLRFISRFTVRDFQYNEEEMKADKEEMTRLSTDKKKQFVSDGMGKNFLLKCSRWYSLTVGNLRHCADFFEKTLKWPGTQCSSSSTVQIVSILPIILYFPVQPLDRFLVHYEDKLTAIKHLHPTVRI